MGTSPPPPQSPLEGRGSPLRVIAGAVLFVAALGAAVFGFLTLVRVLDGGGYGTRAMREALAILGVAGALFATAIATLIWDVAKRFER